MKEYLFVYGTLRKDYDLKLKNKVIDDLQYVGQGKVGASMYDIGRYPGAVRSAAGDEVVGDVFLLTAPERVLRILDKYEGITEGREGEAEFVRKKNRIRLRSGKYVNAWIYWYNHDVDKKLKIKYKNYHTYKEKKLKH
ncbi:MAG TPA: gamma-glutamylcyclotransferase family protein [Puia sp.]|jgi:gamma-glutamylcyclotransferase (GGCT)/AIG2-like uncharacterized protein YtfP|nr:gamma-glutamylcyclotransferase family protein [Puia sp.]